MGGEVSIELFVSVFFLFWQTIHLHVSDYCWKGTLKDDNDRSSF